MMADDAVELDPAVRPLHDEGWEKFLAQLATAAEGGRA
jgi:hypothetical protein